MYIEYTRGETKFSQKLSAFEQSFEVWIGGGAISDAIAAKFPANEGGRGGGAHIKAVRASVNGLTPSATACAAAHAAAVSFCFEENFFPNFLIVF